MLPIIQSLWIGAPLSNLEKLCVQSFLDHGHEFHLYTYADIAGVPDGAVIKDGNEILPWGKLTSGKVKDMASLSDYFRYALLNKEGGYWVDTDTICLRPFDFPDPIIFCGHPFGAHTFANCLLRFPAGHPLMKTMQKLCESRLHTAGWGRTEFAGPPVLTEQIHKSQLQHLAYPRMRFFLPQPNEADFFDDSYRDGLHFPANTHALHLFNSVLIKLGIDKNAQFDAESLVEQLKTRHNIPQVADAPRVTTVEIHALQRARGAKLKRVTRRRKSRERILQFAAAALAVALVASHL